MNVFDELEDTQAGSAFDELDWEAPKAGSAFDELDWKQPEPAPTPAIALPQFETPLGVTSKGPIYRSELGTNLAPPEPSIYEEPTFVDKLTNKAVEKITTPLHKFAAPARETVEKAVMLPFQAAMDRLEMSPDTEEHPALEKIVQSAPSDKAIDIATGVAESATDMASFFTSPLGIATLAMGGLPAAAQRAVALGFAADMARQVPELAKQLGDELGKPEGERDYRKIANLTASGAQMVGFSALSASHGLRPGADLPMPRSRAWEGPLQTGEALKAPAVRGVPTGLGYEPRPEGMPPEPTMPVPPKGPVPPKPAPTPAPTAPATPAKPRTLTPAVRADDNPNLQVTATDHGTARIQMAREHETIPMKPQNEGFLDENGNWLTRAEAADRFFEITGKRPNTPNSLRSEDLKENNLLEHLKQPAEAAKTTEPAEPAKLTPEEYVNRPVGVTSPEEIGRLTEDEVMALSKAKREGASFPRGLQRDAIVWGTNQSPDILPEIERLAKAEHPASAKAYYYRAVAEGIRNANNLGGAPVATYDALVKSGDINPKPPTPPAAPDAQAGQLGGGTAEAGSIVEGTALKNAAAEIERTQLGITPFSATEAQAMAPAWVRAGETLLRDPDAGRTLVQQLATDPTRAVSGDEAALLLRHKTALLNRMNDAAERTLTTTGEAKVLAQADYTKFSAEFEGLTDAVKSSASVAGRRLRWQQALAYEDFSFASQERLLAASKGRPLTDTERVDLQNQLEEYKKKLAALEKHNADKEQNSVDIGVTVAVKKAHKTAKTGRAKPGEMTPQEQVADLTGKIGKKIAEKDFSSAGSFIQKLMRSLVESGVRGRDNLVNAVHGVLSGIDPNITRRESATMMAGYGDYKPFPKDAVTVLVAGYRGELREIAKLEHLAEGIAPLRSGKGRAIPTAEERAFQKQVAEAKKKGGYTITNPELQLKTAMDAVQRRLANQIADLEKQIATREKIVKDPTRLEYDAEANKLKARRDELKKQFDEVFPKQPMTEIERLKLWKDRTQRRIGELQDMLRNGDVEIKPRRPPVELDAAGRKLQADLNITKEKIKHARDAAAWEKMTVFQKAKRGAVDTYDTARMLMTTGEFSFILRQGKYTFTARPIMTMRALPDMFRAMRNPQIAHEVNLKITEDPLFYKSKQARLHITDEMASLTRQEEITAGRWAHAIPIVSHFNRAANAFLNKIRFDQWKAMRKTFSRGAEPTALEDAQYAMLVNEMTGRGGLGSAEQAAVVLGRVAFAPRYTVSRFQLLAGHAAWKGSARSRAVIASEYARSLIGLGLYYSLVYAGLYALGKKPDITFDKRSSDFGKLKIGDTRIDPLAGLAQASTFLGRTWTGETKLKGKVTKFSRGLRGLLTGESVVKPKFGQTTWGEVLGRQARGKLHPIPSSIVNLFNGTAFDGSETTILKETGNLVGPITYYDIYNALQEQDVPEATAMSLLAFLGEGLQTYNQKSPQPFRLP